MVGLLRAGGFETLALTPAGEAELDDIFPAGRIAALFGAEGPGLPAAPSREHPSCPVGGGSNAVLTAAHAAAEARLVEIYGATPLDEIARAAVEQAKGEV